MSLRRRSTRTTMATLMLLALTLSGCAIPTDESAQAIDPESLPESLRPGITTTTTTTAPAPLTEARTVYLLTNPQDIERTVVVAVERQVNPQATVAGLLETLFGETTSPEEQDLGYFNTLELFEIASATVSEGVATVDIAPLSPDDPPPPGDTLGLAAAQLVFTVAAAEGVDGVRILLEGEEVSIPTSDGDSEPGAVLLTGAFEQFQPDFAPTSTTVAEPTDG